MFLFAVPVWNWWNREGGNPLFIFLLYRKFACLITVRHWNILAKPPRADVLRSCLWWFWRCTLSSTSYIVCGRSVMWFWSADCFHSSLYFLGQILCRPPKSPLLSNLLAHKSVLRDALAPPPGSSSTRDPVWATSVLFLPFYCDIQYPILWACSYLYFQVCMHNVGQVS